MKRIAVLLALGLSACPVSPSTPSTTVTDPTPKPVLEPVGLEVIVDNDDFNVTLSAKSEIKDAVIKINGLQLAYKSFDYYYAKPNPVLTPGDAVTLEITLPDGRTITGSGKLPAPVTLTEPIAESEHSVAAPISLKWTVPSNPKRLIISKFVAGTANGIITVVGETTGDARGFNIPAGNLPASKQASLFVLAENAGTLSGPVTASSSFVIRSGESASVLINTIP
jgi:hypothetical protein